MCICRRRTVLSVFRRKARGGFILFYLIFPRRRNYKNDTRDKQGGKEFTSLTGRRYTATLFKLNMLNVLSGRLNQVVNHR